MNLTCPSCDTTFHIDPGLLGPAGRQVRCGSCAHEWTQMPEPEAPAALEEPYPPEPDAPTVRLESPGAPDPAGAERAARRTGAKARPAPGAGRRVAAGWIVFLLVLGGLAAGAYFGRAQIVAVVPATAELYRLAGLPVEPPLGEGLELREVKSVRRMIDGQRVVVIEGLVANVSDLPLDVPSLRASVLDAAGAQIDEWVFSANSANLAPGDVTEFKTTTRNAPREGSLGIDFVASIAEGD